MKKPPKAGVLEAGIFSKAREEFARQGSANIADAVYGEFVNIFVVGKGRVSKAGGGEVLMGSGNFKAGIIVTVTRNGNASK